MTMDWPKSKEIESTVIVPLADITAAPQAFSNDRTSANRRTTPGALPHPSPLMAHRRFAPSPEIGPYLRDNVALLVVVDVLLGSPSAPTNGAPANTTRVATPHGAGAAPAAGAGAEFTPAPVSGSSSRKDAGAAARLVIANTHLVFNPKRGDVKTAQLMLLTDKVER